MSRAESSILFPYTACKRTSQVVLFMVSLLWIRIFAAEPVHIESLMAQSRKMELRYEGQNLIHDDVALEQYLNEVLEGLLRPGELERYNLKVRVLRSRSINAFATPHGVIYICTGLLARMTNEAQLAALLGHELIHIINRHSEKNLSRMKASSQSSAQARIGLGLLLGDGISGVITGAALRSAVTGYSRDLEREADSLGLGRMVVAGYPAREFHALFLLLQEHLFTEKIKEPFFFSTHPLVQERIRNYYQIIGKDTLRAGQGEKNEDRFRRKARGAVFYDARINYAAGRPDLAGYQLERLLASDSCDVESLVLMGDLERLMSSRSMEAIIWYRKALECDPENTAALRAMGYMYFLLGQMEDACLYLGRYCEAVPSASDIEMAKEFVRRCKK